MGLGLSVLPPGLALTWFIDLIVLLLFSEKSLPSFSTDTFDCAPKQENSNDEAKY